MANLAKDPTYISYRSMKARCLCETNDAYQKYGGKGITIHKPWLESYENFKRDMGPRPQNTTLDRIDNAQGYNPENCRWADKKAQANNRSNNKRITHNGKTQTLAEWADTVNVSRRTLWNRINVYKWSVEQALTTPLHTKLNTKSI